MELSHGAEPEISVGELGESGVLRRILAQLGEAQAASVGPGDDCAVVGVQGELVVTSDTMIEGPDFRLAWHSGYELGWKLAATNLSDVAAMGATPTGLTVSLACPRETPVQLLEEIARGLDAACRELAPGCGVVGGDLSRAPVLTAAVTAFGELAGHDPVLRSGAREGDIVAYAGELGLAGLGLALLFSEASEATETKDSTDSLGLDARIAVAGPVVELRRRHPALIRAQLAPTPPVGLGVAAGVAGATAMLDVSDGLALDASRLAQASEVTVALDSAMLLAAFGNQGGERVPLEAILEGGEDHGLLATFPQSAELPAGFHAVGRVQAKSEHGPVLCDQRSYEPRGWDPYAGAIG